MAFFLILSLTIESDNSTIVKNCNFGICDLSSIENLSSEFKNRVRNMNLRGLAKIHGPRMVQ